MNPMSAVRLGLPADTHLGRGLRLLYWRLLPRSLKVVHPWVLNALAQDKPAVRFVQVGSNDAGYGDPLRYHILHSGWRGLMIEPLPFVYQRLRQRYAGMDGLCFENVAIDREPGERVFYHLRPDSDPSLPPWYDQLGSFLKDNVLKHAPDLPDIATRLTQTVVPCMSFQQVCERNGIEQLDVLHIDAEGYDAAILASVDLARFAPAVVLFEHKHLSAADYAACLDQLTSAGYLCNADKIDTLALRRDVLSRSETLQRAWQRARRRLHATPEQAVAGGRECRGSA